MQILLLLLTIVVKLHCQSTFARSFSQNYLTATEYGLTWSIDHYTQHRLCDRNNDSHHEQLHFHFQLQHRGHSTDYHLQPGAARELAAAGGGLGRQAQALQVQLHQQTHAAQELQPVRRRRLSLLRCRALRLRGQQRQLEDVPAEPEHAAGRPELFLHGRDALPAQPRPEHGRDDAQLLDHRLWPLPAVQSGPGPAAVGLF